MSGLQVDQVPVDVLELCFEDRQVGHADLHGVVLAPLIYQWIALHEPTSNGTFAKMSRCPLGPIEV